MSATPFAQQKFVLVDALSVTHEPSGSKQACAVSKNVATHVPAIGVPPQKPPASAPPSVASPEPPRPPLPVVPPAPDEPAELDRPPVRSFLPPSTVRPPAPRAPPVAELASARLDSPEPVVGVPPTSSLVQPRAT